MIDFPFRLLTVAYGLALLGGTSLVMLGASVLVGLLTFWLGGAALVVALAVTPGINRFFRRADTDQEEGWEISGNLVSEDELRMWDADLGAERRPRRSRKSA